MSAPTERRFHPERRGRILDATLTLIVRVGVRGVTHRRVADAAGVSLSATTYYFRSLDDLLEQAFTVAVDRDVAKLRVALGVIGDAQDPLAAFARVVRDLGADRPGAIIATELGVGALRSDRLAQLAREWSAAWMRALAEHFDPETAELAVLLATGLIQGGVVAERPLDAAAIERLLRRALSEGSAPT